MSLLSLVGFSLLSLILMRCQPAPPVLKVGLVAPFEGRERAVGYDVIYSARLAVREINAAGGVAGYRLALVALDDGGNVVQAEETAVSLTLDPDIIAVVGHWQPETTAAAAAIYADANVPFISPETAVDPQTLPAQFQEQYAGVTPFDETAGELAAGGYDAFQLLLLGLEKTAENSPEISREALLETMTSLQYDGLSGRLTLYSK